MEDVGKGSRTWKLRSPSRNSPLYWESLLLLWLLWVFIVDLHNLRNNLG